MGIRIPNPQNFPLRHFLWKLPPPKKKMPSSATASYFIVQRSVLHYCICVVKSWSYCYCECSIHSFFLSFLRYFSVSFHHYFLPSFFLLFHFSIEILPSSPPWIPTYKSPRCKRCDGRSMSLTQVVILTHHLPRCNVLGKHRVSSRKEAQDSSLNKCMLKNLRM